MDRARQETDKRLKSIENKVGRVYMTYPALLKIQKRIEAYMKKVENRLKDDYRAFKDATDIDDRERLKKVYKDKLEGLTLKSDEFKALMQEFVLVLAETNQKALDIVNDEMDYLYMINYNQVATECRKVGIRVE